MPDQSSVDLIPLVSREQAENAFRLALNLYVGRGKRFNSKQVEKGTGISHRVIDCFRSYAIGHPDYRPLHFGALLSIAKFLGAEFTTEWLSLADQAAFDLPDDEPTPGDLAADTTDDTAAIVRAAKDGRFDGKERDELPATGVRMMNRGAQLIALRRTA